jgi:hypothetical protein
MYERKYASLHEAVQLIADHLAKADPRSYGDAEAAFDAACKQLVLALSEGAVHSEGLFWEPLPPDDYAEKPILPLERNPIDKRVWSNEKCHIINNDANGKHSQLDVTSVSWDCDNLAFEDEWETQYIYHSIRITMSDIKREFFRPLMPTAGEVEIEPSSDHVDPRGPVEVTYATGAPGRPTSMHLIEAEMRQRVERREQLATMRAEAEYLSCWLATKHPFAARAKPKTIQTKLGRVFRQLIFEFHK